METSLYTVKAILILDNDGKRLLAKYYSQEAFPSVKEQKAFEANLYSKTSKNLSAEIIMFEGYTCVFRSNVDLIFYVIGDSKENELVLFTVLTTLYDSVSQILKKNVERRALLENLDMAFLCIDELCDNGVILETEPSQLVPRVGAKSEEAANIEGSVTQQVTQKLQVLQHAKEQFKWSLLK